MTVKTKHYIYGIDIRSSETELTYDNGASSHPANWGSYLVNAKCYETYRAAMERLEFLYQDIRNGKSSNLSGISFGVLTYSKEHQLTEKTAEERMAELNAAFDKSFRQ
ncbi:hypothetical protein D3C78_1129090 [compost metagenome]